MFFALEEDFCMTESTSHAYVDFGLILDPDITLKSKTGILEPFPPLINP